MLILSNAVTSYHCSYISYLISCLISIFDPTPMYYNYHFATIRAISNPLRIPFVSPFLGGSSAASPLKMWDVVGPYMRTLFKHKKLKILNNFDEKALLMCCSNFKEYFLIFLIKGLLLKYIRTQNFRNTFMQ